MAATRRTRAQIQADYAQESLLLDEVRSLRSDVEALRKGQESLREALWRLDLRMIVSELGSDPEPAQTPSFGPPTLLASGGRLMRREMIGNGELVLMDDSIPGTYAMELTRAGHVIASGRVPRYAYMKPLRDVIACLIVPKA